MTPESLSVPKATYVGNILGALSRSLSDRVDEDVTEVTGLSRSTCYAIVQIGTEPGSSIQQLTGMLDLQHSSLVRLLEKLEKQNMITREKCDPTDARVVKSFLTLKGEDYFTRILDARRDVLTRALEGVTPSELDLLQNLISKITPNVVRPGDDQHYACRLCELEACPQEICPVNCAHKEHVDPVEVPFRRVVDSQAAIFENMAVQAPQTK